MSGEQAHALGGRGVHGRLAGAGRGVRAVAGGPRESHTCPSARAGIVSGRDSGDIGSVPAEACRPRRPSQPQRRAVLGEVMMACTMHA